MSRNNLKLLVLFFLIQGCIIHIQAQDLIIKNAKMNDAKIAFYLKDTLNAPFKIQELTDSAMERSDKKDQFSAIEDYQIALALAPYAGDSLNILASLYVHFSGLLHNSGAENMANVYAEKALMENRRANKKASVWRYNLLSTMVSKYIQHKEYDSADIYYKEAEKEAWATGQHLFMAAAENNIGMLYELRNMHDSAYNLFIHSIKILGASNRNDSLLLGSINDNIALNYFGRNKFDIAEKYYLQNIILFTRIKIPFGVFKSDIGTANCMISLHNYSGELSYVNKAENCMVQNAVHFNSNDRITLLQCRQQYYTALGDLKQALVQQTEITSIKDSLVNEQKKNSDKLMQVLTDAEIMKANRGIQIYNLQLQRNKETLNESRRKTRISLFISLIIGLSATIIIALLILYFRNKQKSENKIREQKEELALMESERQKLEQEKIQQELNYKKGDLRNVGMYLAELNTMQETFSGKLQEIKNLRPEEQKNSITSLLQEINSKIYSQERLRLINESIEQVNVEFHKKLITLYPNLTKSELELCGYFKLNMSNKEISTLKGVGQDAVKVGRHRLRKKLNLSPEEDIYKTLAVL
jgi:hypothetical protein